MVSLTGVVGLAMGFLITMAISLARKKAKKTKKTKKTQANI